MLVEKLDEGYDLVSGSRVNRSESVLTRRMPSLVANALLRRVSGCNVRDMGGFKVMRGDLARRLRLRSGQHRFLPALVHMLGGRVGEVSVSAPQRFAGKSKYSLRRMPLGSYTIVVKHADGTAEPAKRVSISAGVTARVPFAGRAVGPAARGCCLG